MDLLTGCFEGGLYLLRGLGGGRFEDPKPMLDKEGAWIRLGAYWDYEEKKWTEVKTSRFAKEHGVSATPVDFDNDGDLDLLLGASTGSVFLRFNEGSATQAAFATHSEQVKAKGGDLKVPGGSAMVITADWDDDGMWDLLSGSASGGVYWFRNVGKAGAPEFGTALCLVEPIEEQGVTTKVTRPGSRVQIAAADYNDDGCLDLLVGDYQSVAVEKPVPTAEERTRIEALRKEIAALRKEMTALYEDRTAKNNGDRQAAREDPEIKKVSEKMSRAGKELAIFEPRPTRHGWVWLYARKPGTRAQ